MPRPYPPEFRQRALDLVRSGRSVPEVAFISRAKSAGPPPSLGSVGDPYDNAVVESFWGRMQVELLNRQR